MYVLFFKQSVIYRSPLLHNLLPQNHKVNKIFLSPLLPPVPLGAAMLLLPSLKLARGRHFYAGDIRKIKSKNISHDAFGVKVKVSGVKACHFARHLSVCSKAVKCKEKGTRCHTLCFMKKQ